jgi:prepilin-type N-terminal cleavage/methylation domain-containing protein
MKRSRGFTLIELLVVVAIIALLIAILLPSLGRAKEASNRAICAANLKGQGQATVVYAGSFDDSLPVEIGTLAIGVQPGSETDLSQQEALFTNNILTAANGSTGIAIFYCPSNGNQTQVSLINGGSMGYLWLNDRWWAGSFTYPTLPPQGASITGTLLASSGGVTRNGNGPNVQYQTKSSLAKNASDTELAFDMILSMKFAAAPAPLDTGSNLEAVGSFGTVGSSHLTSRTIAGGANVLAMDSSVNYRKFSYVLGKSVAFQMSNGTYFWLPGPNP